MASTDQNEREDLTAAGEVHHGMDVDAVENEKRTELVVERYVQPADGSQALIVSPIGDALHRERSAAPFRLLSFC